MSSQAFDPELPAIFAPFRGLSPDVRSLRANFVSPLSSQIFDWDSSDALLTIANPLSPLVIIGSLDIFLRGGMRPVVDQLFSLPGGIHFRKLSLRWFQGGDPLSTTGLVERCSHTIESLDIASYIGTPVRHGVRNHSLLLSPTRYESAPSTSPKP